MDILFKQLKRNGNGCHVGPVYAGAFGYANDVALVAPSLYSLKCIVLYCIMRPYTEGRLDRYRIGILKMYDRNLRRIYQETSDYF